MRDLTSSLGILIHLKIASVNTGHSTLNFLRIALSIVILWNTQARQLRGNAGSDFTKRNLSFKNPV